MTYIANWISTLPHFLHTHHTDSTHGSLMFAEIQQGSRAWRRAHRSVASSPADAKQVAAHNPQL